MLGNNDIDDAVCFQAEFTSHTVVSKANGKLCTTLIYRFLNRSVCPFWDHLLDKVWSLFKRELHRVLMTWSTHRSCANFKCKIADVNNEFCFDFMVYGMWSNILLKQQQECHQGWICGKQEWHYRSQGNAPQSCHGIGQMFTPSKMPPELRNSTTK